jgi:hypothetical protein
MGAIGLIMNVLEAAFDLKLKREKKWPIKSLVALLVFAIIISLEE